MSFQELVPRRIWTYHRTMTGFIFFLLSFPLLIAPGLTSPQICSLNFDSSANSISANLANADISEVAKMLSQQADIRILLDKRISSHKMTLSFQDMPIEAGIKKLFASPLSTAFIFSKEKTPSGEEIYRLNTAKIFKGESLLSNDFTEFKKGDSPKLSSDSVSGPKSENPLSGKSGSTRHKIMQTRKNLSGIRNRNETELGRVSRTIMSLRAELSRNPSPEKRSEIMGKLRRAEGELSSLRTGGRRMILSEEKSLRGLADAASAEAIRKKQRLSEKQRQSGASH